MLLKKNYLKYNIIINKIKQTLINKDKKNNIYKNKYLIKYRYKICLNYNPKLLLNIIKNKIYFYILNYFNKNMLYIPYIKNFKKIYNIKTMWLLLLKKIKIIFKFLLISFDILQYRWFYFIKNIYIYLFKPLHLESKNFYLLKLKLKIKSITFKKIHNFTTMKTKKKRSLKRKLQKKIYTS